MYRPAGSLSHEAIVITVPDPLVDYRQQLLRQGYTLAPATVADGEVLLTLFASTHLAMQVLSQSFGWSDAARLEYVRLQCHCQERAYRGAGYAGAWLDLVRWAGHVVGRLYLLHRPGEQLRLLDITLLPEYRGQGHGTALLRTLQTEASRIATPLIALVEKENPACHFYTRLGFFPTDPDPELPFHQTWQWSPPSRIS